MIDLKCEIKDVILWLEEDNQLISYDTNINLNNEIIGIEDNSKLVSKDYLFICKGNNFKKDYLVEAINKGILAFVTDNNEFDYEGYIFVKDIRKSMAIIASKFYKESWKKMTIIAITATKGKTTTSYMIKSIIDSHIKDTNYKCAILSSAENYCGKDFEPASLSTKEPIDLHRSFFEMVNNNCRYCVLEVSSQALKYDRVYGINFDIGCFINIGEDHISEIEHPTFEDYFISKKKLLEMSKKVIISDELDIFRDDYIIFSNNKNNNSSKYYSHDISTNDNMSNFFVNNEEYHTNMIGNFNIENALCAISVAKELGIDYKDIKNGLSNIYVPGRMEVLKIKNDKVVVVDYAHNKLSFEELMKNIKEMYNGYKIVSLFGCTGDKAKNRRYDLPVVAEKYSDYIYITEDDSGTEDLSDICNEIASNIKDKTKYEIEYDRNIAVEKAITKYDNKAVILLLGKGRENAQKRGSVSLKIKSDYDMAKQYAD